MEAARASKTALKAARAAAEKSRPVVKIERRIDCPNVMKSSDPMEKKNVCPKNIPKRDAVAEFTAISSTNATVTSSLAKPSLSTNDSLPGNNDKRISIHLKDGPMPSMTESSQQQLDGSAVSFEGNKSPKNPLPNDGSTLLPPDSPIVAVYRKRRSRGTSVKNALERNDPVSCNASTEGRSLRSQSGVDFLAPPKVSREDNGAAAVPPVGEGTNAVFAEGKDNEVEEGRGSSCAAKLTTNSIKVSEARLDEPLSGGQLQPSKRFRRGSPTQTKTRQPRASGLNRNRKRTENGTVDLPSNGPSRSLELDSAPSLTRDDIPGTFVRDRESNFVTSEMEEFSAVKDEPSPDNPANSLQQRKPVKSGKVRKDRRPFIWIVSISRGSGRMDMITLPVAAFSTMEKVPFSCHIDWEIYIFHIIGKKSRSQSSTF